MKLAVVVQRYGAEISGGAELHARYIAEHLAARHEVEVVTTCARDYITWRNEFPAGVERINGLCVRRFPVARERVPERFGRASDLVFERVHSFRNELDWLDEEGPASPALVAHLTRTRTDVDFFVFFSVRYYHAYHGVRAVSDRAVLVPTAERDPALGVALFGSVFRGVRAVMYNSPEEQALIHAVSDNRDVPGVVVGTGSAIPAALSAARFRQKFGISAPFVVYVGRIDENKGCKELFAFFEQYARTSRQPTVLVLMGHSLVPIPESPYVKHLGFVSDEDKFDGIAASDALIMPSFFESLSMVALEAWALGKPVLANGRCDVLRGQVVRSNAGLYYESFQEFAETLRVLTVNRDLAAAMGRNGRAFYREHYDWPVVEGKYERMLASLHSAGTSPSALEPEPGWLAARRRTLPPARQVVEALPSGPVLAERPAPKPATTRRRGLYRGHR